ncbi:MAG: thioredoxin-like domain-containing protein [Bacteroidales bacterium]|nr:redoxin domain-containing protein [Bacteroidales bacterium]MDD4213381.1 thioredoxin-like domain-containing protein [Bacteroidales bacterium]
MKKIKLTLFCFFIVYSFSSAQPSITYTITGLNDCKSTLYSTHGSLHFSVDSCISSKGCINFAGNSNLSPGVYRISFMDSLFTDIIVNHEDIVMTNNIYNLIDSLKVISSEENKIYHEYWRAFADINDSIELISELGNVIYEANNHTFTPDLDSMAHKANKFSKKLDSITNSLIIKSQGLYVEKLLKAYLTPDWNEYKKRSDAKKYRNKYEFLKEHFFDNIDFSDSTLLNSEVFYVLSTKYLTEYIDAKSDSAYIKALNFILEKTTPTTPVYDYLLHLFLNTFEDESEDVFLFLVDNYLLKNTCQQTEQILKISERAEIIKKLKPENPAPDFTVNDINTKPVTLYSLQAKNILLMFWSSDCSHCEEAMPQIIEIFSRYKPLGLEIVSFAIDKNINQWKNAVTKNKMNWINVSDLLGFESPVIKTYNAYSTPTFYLIDSNKIIISRIYSPKQMNEVLERAFKN